MAGSDKYTEGLEVYLVGGAVRDELLGIASKDRDYVVVGADAAAMKDRGFRPVGKDFPVFLHPESNDEYALARTERKTSPGYAGFEFHAAPDVTLEQDLSRRDLTINAMARDQNDQLIDPFRGLEDLEAGRLRHVSDAFSEDPVRVLRTARFCARYADRDFKIDDQTHALMRSMVNSGEVDALVPERIWQEVRSALDENTPSRFFEALRECGALQKILPEVDTLWGVPQTARYHPEIDTGVHVMMALDVAARAGYPNIVRYAVLVHDLGKGLTPDHVLPSHRGHDEAGVPLVEDVSRRWRVPSEYRALAVAVARWHLRSHMVFEMRPQKTLQLLESIDALRRPERLRHFNQACLADVRGRLGREDDAYPQAAFLEDALEAARAVSAERFVADGLSGAAIGEAMRRARTAAIAQVKNAEEHRPGIDQTNSATSETV